MSNPTAKAATSPVVVISVTITSAQILNAVNSPVEILPAPGINKAIMVLGGISYLGGTTDYVVNGFFNLNYGAIATNGINPVNNDLRNFHGQLAILTLTPFVYNAAFNAVVNQPIYFVTGDDPSQAATGGDGDLQLTLTYCIVDI